MSSISLIIPALVRARSRRKETPGQMISQFQDVHIRGSRTRVAELGELRREKDLYQFRSIYLDIR